MAPIDTAALASAYVLRIMPLGASITWGVNSPSGNGYREYLRTDLNNAGYAVSYVGTQHNGNMYNNENEGFPGLRIGQVREKAKQDVPKFNPNMYTINLGTNDAVQNFDVGHAGDRMHDLINDLWRMTPDATVVLSTLITNLNADTERRAEDINTQFRHLADDLAHQGKHIILVDMHAGDAPRKADINTKDGTHPTDAGYKKMASLWFNGIIDAARRGFIPSKKNKNGAVV